MSTPTHLLPENCYVCGAPEAAHVYSDHKFWSNADALVVVRADRRMRLAHSREARYVAEYRPY